MAREDDDVDGVAARIAAFIGSRDWSTVRQGIELLLALGDDATLAELARGLSIDESDALEIPDSWRRRVGVSGENAENLALLLLASVSPSPLAGLLRLDLGGLESLRDIEPLRVAVNLEKLRLDGCSALADGRPLGALNSLRSLTAIGSQVFLQFPDRGLERLESLAVSLERQSSISPLASMVSLRRLVLMDCDSVMDLSPFSRLGALRSLRIVGAGATDLGPIGSLATLEELSISGLGTDVDCAPLRRLAGLRRLELLHATSLDLSRLLPEGAFPRLEEIDVARCRELRGFRGVRGGSGITSFRGSQSQSCFPEPIGSAFEESSEVWLRTLPAERVAQSKIAAAVMLDALIGVGGERARWPEVRECLAAAIARGGVAVADFMLGNVVYGRGSVHAVTSSLVLRAAESVSAEWRDDAVVMLCDACAWPGLSAGARLDLSNATLLDRPRFTRLPQGTQALLPDGRVAGNAA